MRFICMNPLGENTMADVLMVILTVALFAAAGVYIAICDRL